MHGEELPDSREMLGNRCCGSDCSGWLLLQLPAATAAARRGSNLRLALAATGAAGQARQSKATQLLVPRQHQRQPHTESRQSPSLVKLGKSLRQRLRTAARGFPFITSQKTRPSSSFAGEV